MGDDEPQEIMGNDLEERLKTTRNRAEIALLLIAQGREELLPTMLEDIYFGTQLILDKYCVKST